MKGSSCLEVSGKSGSIPAGPRYPAKRSPFLVYLFQFYSQALIRKQFTSLRVKNAKALTLRDPSKPTLCISNHCNWWDGLSDFMLVSLAAPGARFHVMIEELHRFPFLCYLGGFSVEKDSARSAIHALDYSARLLNEDPRNLLWIYPQGKVCPQDKAPLDFANGVAYLLKRMPDINLLPVAQYYTFINEDRPEILIEVGEPISLTSAQSRDREEVTALLESEVAALLDDIRSNLAESTLDEFSTLIQGELNPFKQVEFSLHYSWEKINGIYRPFESLFKPSLPNNSQR